MAVRVNPNVDAGTHQKITTGTYENKFGVAFEEIEGVYARAAKLKNLSLRGLQTHIGSQLTDVQPFEEAVNKLLPLGPVAVRAARARVFQHRRRFGYRVPGGSGQRLPGLVAPPGAPEHPHPFALRGDARAAAATA